MLAGPLVAGAVAAGLMRAARFLFARRGRRARRLRRSRWPSSSGSYPDDARASGFCAAEVRPCLSSQARPRSSRAALEVSAAIARGLARPARGSRSWPARRTSSSARRVSSRRRVPRDVATRPRSRRSQGGTRARADRPARQQRGHARPESGRSGRPTPTTGGSTSRRACAAPSSAPAPSSPGCWSAAAGRSSTSRATRRCARALPERLRGGEGGPASA